MLRLMTVVFALCALSACNTFAGLGKDLQKAGETLENSATRNP